MADVLLLPQPRLPFSSNPHFLPVKVNSVHAGGTGNATIPTGLVNGMLLFCLANAANNKNVTSVTFGGQAMTLLTRFVSSGAPNYTSDIWALANPPVGSYTAVVNWDNGTIPGESYMMCVLENAHQTIQNGASGGTYGASSSPLGPSLACPTNGLQIAVLSAGNSAAVAPPGLLVLDDGQGDGIASLSQDGAIQWTNTTSWTIAAQIILPANSAQDTDVVLVGPENHGSDVYLGQSFSTSTAGYADVAVFTRTTLIVAPPPSGNSATSSVSFTGSAAGHVTAYGTATSPISFTGLASGYAVLPITVPIKVGSATAPSSASTVVITTTTDIPAGSKVLVAYQGGNNAPSSVHIASVADPFSNPYVVDTLTQNGANDGVSIASADTLNKITSGSTITVTTDANTTAHDHVWIYYVQGLVPGHATTSAHNTGSSGTQPMDSGASSVVFGSILNLAITSINSTTGTVAGTGYSLLDSVNDTKSGGTEYQIVNGSGVAQDAQATQSGTAGSWGIGLVVYLGSLTTATATSAITFTGSATGHVTEHGTAASTVTFTGLAAGTAHDHVITGSAAGTVVFTGLGAGSVHDHVISGTANSAVTITGLGAGTAHDHLFTGTASSSVTFTGLAAGTAHDHLFTGSATSTVAFTGSALATNSSHGTAAGSVTFTGLAAGTAHDHLFTGTATSAVTFTGLAAGTITTHGNVGSAIGSVTFIGTAIGSVSIATTDSASGSDVSILKALSIRNESGVASETSTQHAGYTRTDSAAGIDLSTERVASPRTESASATDTSFEHATFAYLDTGAGVEVSNIVESNFLVLSDSATGTEQSTEQVAFLLPDTGSFYEKGISNSHPTFDTPQVVFQNGKILVLLSGSVPDAIYYE